MANATVSEKINKERIQQLLSPRISRTSARFYYLLLLLFSRELLGLASVSPGGFGHIRVLFVPRVPVCVRNSSADSGSLVCPTHASRLIRFPITENPLIKITLSENKD